MYTDCVPVQNTQFSKLHCEPLVVQGVQASHCQELQGVALVAFALPVPPVTVYHAFMCV
jgi:hypothetical protein